VEELGLKLTSLVGGDNLRETETGYPAGQEGAWSPAGEGRYAVPILVVNEAEERAEGTGRRRPMCWQC
jgi:hypothetical protein